MQLFNGATLNGMHPLRGCLSGRAEIPVRWLISNGISASQGGGKGFPLRFGCEKGLSRQRVRLFRDALRPPCRRRDRRPALPGHGRASIPAFAGWSGKKCEIARALRGETVLEHLGGRVRADRAELSPLPSGRRRFRTGLHPDRRGAAARFSRARYPPPPPFHDVPILSVRLEGRSARRAVAWHVR
jgi:hypothetical protein